MVLGLAISLRLRLRLLIMKDRLYQFALIASTLGYSWLGMQIVHELGHVLAAYFRFFRLKRAGS